MNLSTSLYIPSDNEILKFIGTLNKYRLISVQDPFLKKREEVITISSPSINNTLCTN